MVLMALSGSKHFPPFIVTYIPELCLPICHVVMGSGVLTTFILKLLLQKTLTLLKQKRPWGPRLCLDRVWEQMGRQCWAGVTHTETESE